MAPELRSRYELFAVQPDGLAAVQEEERRRQQVLKLGWRSPAISGSR